MKQERRLPSWAETGLSSRGEHASSEMLMEDMRLQKRILQEAGPVVTRPIRERLYPQGGRYRVRMDVRLDRDGIHIGGGLLARLDLSTTRRCHVDWNHATKTLYITVSEDGPWRLPPVSSSKLGGAALVATLEDYGMPLGTYSARVEDNVIIVETRKGGQWMTQPAETTRREREPICGLCWTERRYVPLEYIVSEGVWYCPQCGRRTEEPPPPGEDDPVGDAHRRMTRAQEGLPGQPPWRQGLSGPPKPGGRSIKSGRRRKKPRQVSRWYRMYGET